MLTPRASSPQPRASTSSSRSALRTGADFEAALLDPGSTIFLSGSPRLGEPEIRLVEIPVHTPDAPQPVEKRSFESDLRGLTITTPVKGLASPGVIPPTPSPSSGQKKLGSHATMDSIESTTSIRRVKLGPALGIDAELHEVSPVKGSQSHKRRSIFRSPGTASSPDLATLVRRAKEAKGIKPHEEGNAVNGHHTPVAGPSRSSTSHSVQTQASSRVSRERAVSDWDTESSADLKSLPSGDRVASMSEGRRSRQSSAETEGHKSVRSKAKGMLGRMFGTKDPTPTSSPSSSSRPPSTYHPPVPPVPATYAAKARRKATPSQPPDSSRTTPVITSESRFTTPDGRVSATPTNRRASAGSILSVEKPLPAQPNDIPPLPRQSSSRKGSMHIRQPAGDTIMEHQWEPPRTQGSSFSDDVAGMLDKIGQSEPAQELGLAPESLRRTRSKSSDSARRRDRTAEPSPGAISPVPAPRTSSLQHGSTPALGTPLPQRMTSSPHGDSQVSRTSSTSSRREPALSPPLSVSKDDFGPALDTSGEGTIRARKPPASPSPLLPSSVRLVHPPQPASGSALDVTTDALARTSFIDSTPWGAQANGDVETISSPPTGHIEDDEEKGRRLACEFLEDKYSSIPADKVAEFLGGPRNVNSIALRYYMQYFEMKGQNLVEAFRDLCQKLHLKAESQEIDRIIEAFSSRFYECNPNTVFGSPGVVHTVTGAMLMLNTDLHIADLSKHMSRADFVRNAMRAIQESMPGSSTPDLVRDDSFGSNASASVRVRAPVHPTPAPRSASAPVVTSPPPVRSVSDASMPGTLGRTSSTVSSFSYTKSWESEAESALKDIYSAVRADRILLPQGPNYRQSMISIASSVDARGRPIRSPSGNDRINTLKRGSIRGVQGLINNNPYGGFDGRMSPTPSYATSINDAFAFASTIGFASNLSHTVIREQEDEARSVDSRGSLSSLDDMDDDQLALLGAPWAKEGLVWRHVSSGPSKRPKTTKDWKQHFSVLQKGEMHLFTFGQKTGSYGGGSVGGGNWTNNANAIASWDLMHAHAMPIPNPRLAPPSARLNVFSITFSSGEINMFQAGTSDLVLEWVSSVNYWAARRSRQPLQGGVGNIEYGWTRVLDPPSAEDDDRASVRSGRSGFSRLAGGAGGGTHSRRGGGHEMDRVYIQDWQPPPISLMPSPLDEEAQLEALIAWVSSLKDEVVKHKAVEQPMYRLYTTGSKNYIKARANWTSKIKYLHSEIHKYETYIDALRAAISLRVKKQGERKLERSLARSMTSLHRRESEETTVTS